MLSSYPEIEKTYCKSYNVNIIKRSKSQLGTIKNIRSIIKEADAVVSAWGDGYITTPPYKIFYKTTFIKSNKKPSILFPSSLGPFYGKLKRYLSKKGLERFDRIMARDTITFKYLNEIGVKNIHLIPDTAFLLDPVEQDRIHEIFVKESVPRRNQYIGLNISQLLNRLYMGVGVNYPKFMAELVYHLNKAFAGHVLLIPHQICPSCINVQRMFSYFMDDRDAISEVMSYIKDKEIVSPILGEYNSREYKGVITKCEIFIGGRMHSIIAAVSSSIPSVIIQYSHKAMGVMDMIGLSQYVWDFRSPKEELIDMINNMWHSRESLRSDIQTQMIKIRNNAWKAGRILIDTLDKYQI